jgi:hypothetical protein
MKKRIFSLAVFYLLSIALHAQKSSRVKMLYKTDLEFVTGKPSFNFDCNAKNKILLNDFFFKSYVSVRDGDSVYKYPKNRLYAYQTCTGQLFRFLNKKELLLLNKEEEILIYKHLVSKPPTGRTNVTNYYFSMGSEAEVQSLTIKNLKAAFSKNERFKLLIDNHFKYNTDLAAFDETNQMYKINWLLKQTR